MLSYALAIAVAISSLVLFSTAFFMSKIHRRDDFFWSGVGLFYALVLWYCARNITGAVLLGQAAATALLISFSWQTIKLRRAIAEPAKAAATNNFSVLRSFDGLLKRRQAAVETPVPPVDKAPVPTVTEKVTIPDTPKEATPKKAVPNIEPKKTESKQDSVPAVERSAPPVEQPVKKVVKTPAVKSSVDIEIRDNPTEPKPASESVTTPTPLPNKLPNAVTVEGIESPATPPAAKENIEPIPVPGNTPPATPELPTETVKQPTLTTSTEEEKPNSDSEIEAKSSSQPKSALDDLETVEVAEVLEAESDGGANDRQSDIARILLK